MGSMTLPISCPTRAGGPKIRPLSFLFEYFPNHPYKLSHMLNTEVITLPERPVLDNEDNQILNNRPPNISNDYGVPDKEDEYDKELMPNETQESASKQTE